MAQDGCVRVRLEEKDIRKGPLHLTKGNSKWMNGVTRTKITDELTIGTACAVHQERDTEGMMPPATSQEEHSDVAGLGPEPEASLTPSTTEEWKETAAECVRNDLFSKKQFLVNDAELHMGGTVQKTVAKKLNITNEKRIVIFWHGGGGRETVRNTFRKKRQSAQNGMKLAFKGETAGKSHMRHAERIVN
jgi:hypothetical protein